MTRQIMHITRLAGWLWQARAALLTAAKRSAVRPAQKSTARKAPARVSLLLQVKNGGSSGGSRAMRCDARAWAPRRRLEEA